MSVYGALSLVLGTSLRFGERYSVVGRFLRLGVGRMFTFAMMIGWELALHATYFLECIG